MLIHSKELEGYEVQARDGSIGQVTDFYFEEQDWRIRYFVVNTGSWLRRHQVLVSSAGLTRAETGVRAFRIDATREQVRNSPEIDTVRTASREQERALHDYYGWPYYWASAPLPGGLYGIAPTTAPVPPPRPDAQLEAASQSSVAAPPLETESHLWSAHDVRGYNIHATDGDIGHLEDFLVEDGDWSVRFLLVDTRNWLPGKHVVVRPRRLQRLSWPERAVHVTLPREEIKNRPEFDPSQPLTAGYTDQPLIKEEPPASSP